MRIIKFSNRELEKIYNRSYRRRRNIEERVRRIIYDVRSEGDDALARYTRKFDGAKLQGKQFKVAEYEISGAYQNIDPALVASLKLIINNVNKFYKKQLRKSWRMHDDDGVIVGERYEPIERVGIYVPGGSAPLVSSVYMSVLPAKLAGVKKIAIVTPPDEYGRVNSYILVVADLLGAHDIYKIGGAQAVAALAFGTKTVPKVDKIVGPGNAYVSEAKRQVFGHVGVDMIAGPSEIVIIANQFANPDYVIADLASQAEHAEGISVLITTSRSLAKTTSKALGRGTVIMAKNLDEAAQIANNIAPEHLEIIVKRPQKLLNKIRNAGAIFLGPYSPVAVGDYFAGPSHVLPTMGTARFFSGLGVADFMKSSHIISYTKKALERVRIPIEKISGLEGMPKHLESIKVRFQ